MMILTSRRLVPNNIRKIIEVPINWKFLFYLITVFCNDPTGMTTLCITQTFTKISFSKQFFKKTTTKRSPLTNHALKMYWHSHRVLDAPTF